MWWIILIIVSLIILLAIIIYIFNNKNKTKKNSKSNEKIIKEDNDSKIEQAGNIGEKFINLALNKIIDPDDYILSNVILPFDKDRKIEIDCILISKKGIFCIEVKNWVGHIIGRDESDNWLQMYDDSIKSSKYHQNPVKQNKYHCSILYNFLNKKYEINCIVIFAFLEKESNIESSYTYTIYNFNKYYKNLDNNVLSKKEIDYIYNKLSKYCATKEQLEKFKKETSNNRE